MGRETQLPPLMAAIAAAVMGDAPLRALLADDMIYNTEAPAGSRFPYVTIGGAGEADNNVFGALGTEVHQQLDIWTRKQIAGGSSFELGNDSLLAVYQALRRVLHLRPLAIAGFKHVIGSLTLQISLRDPDGQTMHAICDYDVISREAA